MIIEQVASVAATAVVGFIMGWWANRRMAKAELKKEQAESELRLANRTDQQKYLDELVAQEFPALSRR